MLGVIGTVRRSKRSVSHCSFKHHCGNKHDFFGPTKDQNIQSQKKRWCFMFGKALSHALYRNWAHSQLHLQQSPYFHRAHGFLPYTSKSHENSNNGLPPLYILISSQKGSSRYADFEGFAGWHLGGHTVFVSHRRSITSPSLIDGGVRATS